MARSAGSPQSAKKRRSGTDKSYDAFKEYQGKRYTGMKVGRGHKWEYAAGEWVEKKITPDEWEFRYAPPKRRKGKAPEGSGVPVGTEYHWYILADQIVKKLDANNYTTEMVGRKYKINHKRADKGTWSASESAQKRKLIKFLQQAIVELERELSEPAAPKAAVTKAQPKRKQNGRARAKHLAAA
jgi:hypothetical protein